MKISAATRTVFAGQAQNENGDSQSESPSKDAAEGGSEAAWRR
jgi:hypothetical protein